MKGGQPKDVGATALVSRCMLRLGLLAMQAVRLTFALPTRSTLPGTTGAWGGSARMLGSRVDQARAGATNSLLVCIAQLLEACLQPDPVLRPGPGQLLALPFFDDSQGWLSAELLSSMVSSAGPGRSAG